MATFKGNFNKNHDDEEYLEIQIELIVGFDLEDNKKLRNTYRSQLKLEKLANESKLSEKYTLTPTLPKPTYIKGCVVNDKNIPIEDAVVTAKYSEPIF